MTIPPGSFTGDIDVVQIALAAFFLFFAFLIVYLRREDKREGYPLKTTRTARRGPIIGWPAPPPPKTFVLMEGGTAQMPHHYPQAPVEDVATPRNGEPLRPCDPLLSGMGAGAYVLRSDQPMRTMDKDLLLKPLRNAPDWSVRRGEADPRGWRVLASAFQPVGMVADIWVDRAAKILRYFEVRLNEGGTLLVPVFHVEIRRDPEIRVLVLKPEQFVHVPRLSDPDVMTAREEDRLNAFFAGATIYARTE